MTTQTPSISGLLARLREDCDCSPPVSAERSCVVGELRARIVDMMQRAPSPTGTHVRFHDIPRIVGEGRVRHVSN